MDNHRLKNDFSYVKQTTNTIASLTTRPNTQENSINRSKLTLASKKTTNKNNTKTNSPLNTENELDFLLETINELKPEKSERHYVQEKLQKINANFSKRNEEGEDHFYLESQENYEDYCKFINSKNRIAIMRAIKEKNIELLVEENENMVKKQKKIKSNFYTHDNKEIENIKNRFDNKGNESCVIFNKDANNKKNLGIDDDLNSNHLNNKKPKNNNLKIAYSKNNFLVNKRTELKENEKHLKTHFKAIAVIANKLKQKELIKNAKITSAEAAAAQEIKPLKTCSSSKAFKTQNDFSKPNYSNNQKITNKNITMSDFFTIYNTNSLCNTEELLYKNALKNFPDITKSLQIRNAFTAQNKTSPTSNFDNNKKSNLNPYFNSNQNKTEKQTFYKTLNAYKNSTAENNYLIARIAQKLTLEQTNMDMIESNPLVYNLSFNPLRKEVKKISENSSNDPEQFSKIEYLKTIAFVDNSDKNAKIRKRFKRLSTRISNGNSDYFNNFEDDDCNNDNQFVNDENFNHNFNGDAVNNFFDKNKKLINLKCDNKPLFLKKMLNNNNNENKLRLLNDKMINKNKNQNDLEERIFMENCLYSRQNLEKIAKQVLKKCNFVHDKNKNKAM